MASVESPDLDSGRIMEKKFLYLLQPSISADSSTSLGIVIINELLITILNTGVIYVDSKIYGYYTAALIVGSLVPRLLICVGKAVAFGLVLPGVIRAVHHNVIDYMK